MLLRQILGLLHQLIAWLNIYNLIHVHEQYIVHNMYCLLNLVFYKFGVLYMAIGSIVI